MNPIVVIIKWGLIVIVVTVIVVKVYELFDKIIKKHKKRR